MSDTARDIGIVFTVVSLFWITGVIEEAKIRRRQEINGSAAVTTLSRHGIDLYPEGR